MTDKHKIDEVTGFKTTGHKWDGIEELDRPMPRWWVWIFYATIVWSIGYWIVYPAWPIIFGKDGLTYTKGIWNTTQRGNVAEQLAEHDAMYTEYRAEMEKTSLQNIQQNPELMRVALNSGKTLFGDNCAPCHGSGASGSFGYPNLNDDDWLWGGTIEDIYTTLRHGIRWEHDDDTRISEMPRFLIDEILDREQIADVAHYVMLLSGQEHDASSAQRGKDVFSEQCVTCHMENGRGDITQGAPNLTDSIWLYGNTLETVYETIAVRRRGVMPAWKERLKDREIKELALYVYSLGGGQATNPKNTQAAE